MLDGQIGYIPLQQFNETATDELEAAVKRLSKEGAKGLVFDLRGNGGGYLDQAGTVANLFLKKGVEISSVRGRAGFQEVLTATDDPIAPEIPLIVLTDGRTASASEIVAGALQDHDRAVIVGTTSFGKGLVQTVYPLEGGYALKMTTAKWYTPSGRSIQKERKLLPDGSFVEVLPDSMETDSVRKSRPKFKSGSYRLRRRRCNSRRHRSARHAHHRRAEASQRTCSKSADRSLYVDQLCSGAEGEGSAELRSNEGAAR
jgi:carboxyl-terminal processing protease